MRQDLEERGALGVIVNRWSEPGYLASSLKYNGSIVVSEGCRSYGVHLKSDEGQRALKEALTAYMEWLDENSAMRYPTLTPGSKKSPPERAEDIIREAYAILGKREKQAARNAAKQEKGAVAQRSRRVTRIALAFLTAGAIAGGAYAWRNHGAPENKTDAPTRPEPAHAPRPPSR